MSVDGCAVGCILGEMCVERCAVGCKVGEMCVLKVEVCAYFSISFKYMSVGAWSLSWHLTAVA